MRFSEFFLIAFKYFLRRKWCSTSIGYLNIFSLKAVTIFIISRKFCVGFSICFAGQNNRATNEPDFGRYLFCAWENHNEKYGTKPLFWYQIHQFYDGFKVREWLYQACLWSSRGGAASYLGGSGGMPPPENFEFGRPKNAFSAISVIYFLEITLHFTGEILTKVTNTFNEKLFY